MNPDMNDKLEAAVHGVLRSLPERRAPVGLERRVMAEIARRAALPWWRKSFAHWPASAKAGFVATCGIAAALVVQVLLSAGRSQEAAAVNGSLAGSLERLAMARDLASSAVLAVRRYLGTVPAPWLYGALAVVGSCYAALAAIGTAAYRTLALPRQTP
jgi:hypothetical protein